MATSPYQVRELEVTDIRCRAEGCGAGPGELCRPSSGDPDTCRYHAVRYDEFKELVAAGWRWQEPDPTDRGGARK